MQTLTGAFLDQNGNQHRIGTGEFVDAQLTTAGPPILFLRPANNNDWVVVLIDRQAPYPTQPTLSPLVHWIEVIHPDGSSQELVPFLAMQPPPDSPPHRYDIILYAAPSGPKQWWPLDLKSRDHFPLAAFVSQNNLLPRAVGFYVSK